MTFITGILMLPSLIGFGVLFHVFKKKQPPMDDTNVIGHLSLIWNATTKPHLFVGDKPYFHMDEEDKIRAFDNLGD